jgi:hypothetical protein
MHRSNEFIWKVIYMQLEAVSMKQLFINLCTKDLEFIKLWNIITRIQKTLECHVTDIIIAKSAIFVQILLQTYEPY